jgi:hypothetical protein
VSWGEVFADRYGQWPTDMTADVAFYTGLARGERPLALLVARIAGNATWPRREFDRIHVGAFRPGWGLPPAG